MKRTIYQAVCLRVDGTVNKVRCLDEAFDKNRYAIEREAEAHKIAGCTNYKILPVQIIHR